MSPLVERALQIIGLAVVTCWFVTLGVAAFLWIRGDLLKRRLEKRLRERFTFPEEWAAPIQVRPDFTDLRSQLAEQLSDDDWRFEEMEW